MSDLLRRLLEVSLEKSKGVDLEKKKKGVSLEKKPTVNLTKRSDRELAEVRKKGAPVNLDKTKDSNLSETKETRFDDPDDANTDHIEYDSLKHAKDAANRVKDRQRVNYAIDFDALDDEDDFDIDDYLNNARKTRPNQQHSQQDSKSGASAIPRAGSVDINWLFIGELDSYISQGIRKLGRAVFKPLTRTKLPEIQAILNIAGHGPSTHRELAAAANYVRQHATKSIDVEIDFGEVIAGYEPETKLYVCRDMTYLIVQDTHGQYIYAWPSHDTINAFVQRISKEESPPKLLD